MKDKLEWLLLLIVSIIVIYLVASIIHLSWYIANPEGFWGFSYFIEIIRVILVIVIILGCAFWFLHTLISLLLSFFKKGSNRNEIIKGLGVILILIVMTIINSLWAGGLSFFLSKKLSEKYNYIEISKELINDGKLEAALEYSVNAYEKEQDHTVSSIFILTKLYSATDYDKKKKLLSKYAATINYGYCLKESFKSDESGFEKFEEAILIARSPLLKENSNNLLIFPTISLSEISLKRGDDKKADQYFNEVYKLYSNFEEEDTKYLIDMYLVFSEKAMRIGNIVKSIKLQNECLQIYEDSELSKESSNYLSLLLISTMGEMYIGNYSNASKLLIKAAPIADDKKSKPIYLEFLIVKGQYCLMTSFNKQGNEEVIKKGFWYKILHSFDEELSLEKKLLKESEECYLTLTEKSEDIAGQQSYQYLTSIMSLANFYYVIGNIESALPLYEKALAILEPNKDENKKLYYELFLKHLFVQSKNSNIDINNLKDVEDFIFDNIYQNYLFITEEEKENYILNIEKDINLINVLYIEKNTAVAKERLYDNILGIKNIALFSNSVLREYLENTATHIKENYYDLINKKKKLTASSIDKNNLDALEQINNKIKQLLEQINKDPKFKPIKPKSVNWLKVRESLNENEVAVEMINIQISRFPKAESQYYALLIKPDFKYPEVIPLFLESELLALLNVNGNTETRVNTIYEQNGEKLFDLILKPLEKYLKPNSKLYLSKSGLLHNISFPSLVKNKDWEVNILGSTRQIVNRAISNEPNRAILFGGINYNSNLKAGSNQLFDTIRNAIQRKNVQNLKYTGVEVTGIDDLFKSKNKESKLLMHEMATEDALRNMKSNNYDVIHIATHGYYDGGNTPSSSASGYDNSRFIEQSSLMKSGILLAGANNSNYFEDENDGILTSLEISEMNFSNIDLVVLSACETGLGEVLGSEGIFGLQRAFKLAGVKSLIVSLWEVPDKQTAELMFNFYKYYLKGMTKSEALKNAQKDIRDIYPEPYYWAGFELIE